MSYRDPIDPRDAALIDSLAEDIARFRAIESNHWTVEYMGEGWQIWSGSSLLAVSDDLSAAIDIAVKAI